MYEMSREDARSDLLLSAAVFVFGPVALQLLLGIFGLRLGRTGTQVLVIVLALLSTVLVPLLLMKYRNEAPARVLGLGPGDRSVPVGLLAAVPLLLAGLIEVVIQTAAGSAMIASHPVVALVAGNPLAVVVQLVAWVGVVTLALYATVKARDAFGGLPTRIEDAAWRIGRILAIAAAVTTVLGVATVLLGDATPLAAVEVVVWPLAVAAMIWIVLGRTPGTGTTSMATLITPTVLCGLGNFVLTLSPADIVTMLHVTALSAGVGLGVGILAERTRRGGGVLALAVLIALGTGLAVPVRLGG